MKNEKTKKKKKKNELKIQTKTKFKGPEWVPVPRVEKKRGGFIVTYGDMGLFVYFFSKYSFKMCCGDDEKRKGGVSPKKTAILNKI